MRLIVICAFLLWLSPVVVPQGFITRSWRESLQLANQLVANLTLSEKVGILTGRGIFSTPCVGNTLPVNRPLPNAPSGVPNLCLNDGPAGVRGSPLVTGFPGGMNAASTFSRRLMRARGRALGEEFRGKGINVFLGPANDITRSPKAGRAWEAFGPEPWLSGEATFETILGIQSVGVQACAKHLLANVQENWRYTYTSAIDDRTAHEIYLWPFIKAIEANVSAIMCAYNQVNDTYSCGNEALLGPNGFLAQSGFEGYVISDWGATHDSATSYANAGLDMEQPGGFMFVGGGIFGSGLERAVTSGSVSQERLDMMVSKVLASWFRLGQDIGYPAPNFNVLSSSGPSPNVNVRSDAHTALVRELAQASTVLLKNTGALPLTGKEKTIAAIGLDINPPEKDCLWNACNSGTVVTGWGSGTILLDFVVAPLDALKTFATSNTSGTVIISSPSNDLDSAVEAAASKDVAIVFVNAMSGEFELVEGNLGDRNNLDLWYEGNSLIQGVAAVNNNTIVVVHSTGPVLMSSWCNSPNITAILYAGTPGEQTGPAIVDILYGRANPSGRLPFTIAADAKDYPADILYLSLEFFPTLNFTETIFLDYRHFDQAGITPSYEFGFGLSYTHFTYTGLSVSHTTSGAAVSFTVTNSGDRDGTEIPQLYVGFPQGSGEPPKVLRGFDEVILPRGASTTVNLQLTERDLSVWDTTEQTWVRPSGRFDIFIGASSRDIRLSGKL